MKRAIFGTMVTALILRLAMLAGAGDAVQNWSREVTADGRLMRATVSVELGAKPEEEPEPEPAQIPVRRVRVSVEPVQAWVENPVETAETVAFSENIEIRNDTSFWVDSQVIAPGDLTQKFISGQPQILIIHTHSSEAYTPSPGEPYEPSDTYRTEDMSHSVIRVGDELTSILEEYGLTVLHDRNLYDYPNYTGSYTRSGEAVERYLAEYPEIAMVIDLHRDAIGTAGNMYRTEASQQGSDCAQVMMLIGTGENGLYHPNWRENLKLAVYLQSAVDARYPSLMRPIALKQERYNQQLTTGSMILEVGSAGNTLEEALRAIRLYGDAIGPALRQLMNN